MNHRTSWKMATTLIASAAIAIGCTDGSSPTSTGFKPNLALGDITNAPQDPVFGKILVCKTGDSNISGTFTIVKNSGTGTSTSPVTVAPGKCVEVANDGASDGTASSFGVSENAAVDPANTVQTFVSCFRKDNVLGVITGPTDCAGQDKSALPLNSFHSWVLTYRNVFTPPSGGCTFTLGYWLNHPEAWPVLSPKKLGTVTYTTAQWLTILGTAPKGNGLIQLARQLIAAKLNVASGANPAPAAIAQADALIGGLVVPPVGSGFLDPSVTSSLIEALNSFNTGATGPGSCED